MLSPSDSMELVDVDLKPKVSICQTLEILDDKQLSDLVNVVAEDYRIKYELMAHIRQKQIALAEFGQRHKGRDDGCAFCPQNFHMFHRAVPCVECCRKVCKTCHERGVCSYCRDLRELEYRKREWSVLCPYNSTTFGFGKMVANDLESSNHMVDWLLKAKLELHLIHQLRGDLDSAFVCFSIVDANLELIRQQLMMSLLNYSNTSHFAFIDDSIHEAKVIIQRRSNCIQEISTRVESLSYFHLLSNAVVSLILQAASPLSASKRPIRSCARPLFPRISEDDLTEVELEGVTPYALNPNWFMKPRFASPRGSMRSQLSSRLVNSIVTPDFFKYGCSSESTQNLHDSTEIAHDLSDLFGTDFANSWKKDSFSSGPFAPLAVTMQRQRIDARCGQVVHVRCRITCEENEVVDVLWYNRHRQLTNNGRIRIMRDRNDAWIEIFDCRAADDAGEIVCLVVGDCDVTADAALLVVHEDDIAGEEPFFVEPLVLLHHKSSRIRESMTVQLRCSVIGYPMPYVNFFRDNVRIEEKDEKIQIEHVGNAWMLRISDVTVDDEGVYTAVAINRINKVSSRFRIMVRSISRNADSDSRSSETRSRSSGSRLGFSDV